MRLRPVDGVPTIDLVELDRVPVTLAGFDPFNGFEVLLRGKLFKRRSGLTLDQRLQYLFTGTHYLLSIAMLLVVPSLLLGLLHLG